MSKKVVALFMAFVLLCMVGTGCSSSNTEGVAALDDTVTSDEPIVLKWSHSSPAENDKLADASIKIIEEIKEESGGRLILEHYPANQLGAEREQLEGLNLGVTDIAVLSTGPVAGIFPEIMATNIPYLFPNREVAWQFFDGEAGQDLAKRMEEKTGIKVLGWAENGLRCFTNDKREIKSVEDLKGLKIRTMENPAHMAMVSALGASPQPITFAELYTALQQKTVDGQENPLSLIYSNRLYEVQQYLALDYHVYDAYGVYMNSEKFNSLPADLQELLQRKVKDFCDLERQYALAYDNSSLEKMKESGVVVTEFSIDELKEFKKATAEVEGMIRESAGDEVVDMTLEAVDKIINEMENNSN